MKIWKEFDIVMLMTEGNRDRGTMRLDDKTGEASYWPSFIGDNGMPPVAADDLDVRATSTLLGVVGAVFPHVGLDLWTRNEGDDAYWVQGPSCLIGKGLGRRIFKRVFEEAPSGADISVGFVVGRAEQSRVIRLPVMRKP